MELRNYTPFSALAFEQQHRDGHDMAVLAVRGTFHLVPGEPLVLADEQAPFQFEDAYEGDPLKTSLRHCTDLAPFRPGTDLTLRARAHAPQGQPTPSWRCSVSLGTLSKTLQVHGPRAWTARWEAPPKKLLHKAEPPVFAGWSLGLADPVRVVPLVWELAFGGPLAGSPPAEDGSPDVHAFNPIGWGVPDAASLSPGERIPAPRIESPDDPILTPGQDHLPQGVAPVPPVWQSRLQHAGTLDDAWTAQRHPQLPEDFDYRFHQVAAPGLSMDGFAQGDEWLVLSHMHPRYPTLQVRLPGVRPMALFRRIQGDMVSHPLVLDGVHVDLLAHPATAHLTWRCWQPVAEGVRVVELRLADRAPLLDPAERLKDVPRVPGDTDLEPPMRQPEAPVQPAPSSDRLESEVMPDRKPWYTGP